MNILVTGGAGFIGCNLVRYLRREMPQARVTVLDKLTYAGSRENLADVIDNPRLTFIEGDICEPAAVREALKGIQVVVHLAAESHVDRSIMGAEAAVQTNSFGTFTLLEAARATELLCFLHVSKDEVYWAITTGQCS